MIYIILFLNLSLCLITIFFKSEQLLVNGYLLFIIQAVFNISYLLSRTNYLYSFFLPSYLMLLYITVNQILGGYLASNGYGWNKGLIESYFQVENIKLILIYLILINFILFIVTFDSLSKLKAPLLNYKYKKDSFIKKIIIFFAFFFCSLLQQDWLFSVQLALLIYLIASFDFLESRYRYIYYIIFIFIMLLFNYESKREILMVLLLIIFMESYFNSIGFKLNIKTTFISLISLLIFVSFVLIASIMRGYGELDNRDIINSMIYIPKYITTETFMDSVSDNFELGYNYIVSILSIDFVLNGRIDYLYGLSLLKTLFLPFPREIFDIKPDNIMIIFTKELDYSFYSIGGSYPINLSSELFMNFNFFGLFFFFVFIFLFNQVLTNLRYRYFAGFYFLISVFFIIIFFIFMRGSGLDLLVFCMILALLVIGFLSFLSGKLKVK